jgi:hypothetical protein
MIGSQNPWFRFNRTSILANAPAASGVYAIFNANVWIYVGEGQDIRARLLAHLNGANSCITRNVPSGFQCELWPADQRVARQDALILALNPVCNRRLG